MSGLTSDQSPLPQLPVKQKPKPSQTAAPPKIKQPVPRRPSQVTAPQEHSTKVESSSKFKILSIILGVVCLILVVLLIRSFNKSSTSSSAASYSSTAPAASAPAAPAASAPIAQEQPTVAPQRANRTSQFTDDFTGEYHTNKHSIRIIQAANGKYIYAAWKLPYVMDVDKPTLMLTNGEYNPVNDTIEFRKGNLELDINRDNELTIYINGVYRDHYYMYRD